MRAEFQFDVFPSHSAEEKATVRPLAERLRKDGLRNASQPSTINPQPLGASDWARLLPLSQPSTLNLQPACDPLNKERRFIPLRLDDTPIEGSDRFRKHFDRRCHFGLRPVAKCSTSSVQSSINISSE